MIDVGIRDQNAAVLGVENFVLGGSNGHIPRQMR
jgi:hypothetical protein